jgi:peptidoglycan/LPS O-acetylase OafA/YrhL
MVRSRSATVALVFCIASWLALALAGLNADYKTEIQMAPAGNGYAPTYWEFLESHGFRLLSYFLPYHPNPITWALLIVSFGAFFLPAFAARLAVHTPVRWLCVIAAIGFAYLSIEVLLSFPAADRNGVSTRRTHLES